LSKTNEPVSASAYNFCFFCSSELSIYDIPITKIQSIQEIRDFSAGALKAYQLPTIALIGDDTNLGSGSGSNPLIKRCQFLYGARTHILNPYVIGCHADFIIMENIAFFLNISLEVHDFKPNFGREFVAWREKQYFASVVFVFQVISPFMKFPLSFSTPIMVDVNLHRFMYCKQSEERQSFNFLFWTIPLDPWSWIGLGISCFLLLLLLRGQWFQICSILMRQSCSVINRNKTLIVFIFASIIFTYGYEGVISSLLTVPPPIKIFETL